MTDHSLPRTERLRTFGAIRRLFGQGDGGFVYPLRYVCYTEADEAFGAEVLFSVPKKFHKRANKRNLLRRRTKEAYRLHKALLREGEPRVAIDLALIYAAREITDYKTIEHAVRRILERIVQGL
ncbi:MAG: ribonuclease P protein component [Alistipes sp.]|jgi:ribonuclease P protein component|uniref:ribonuclease P protein component n=1 Tax=Alistipes sp. TaxID=1872444 RepID=UPI001D655027|nr:ribonuclease P protein component [Alistipes sp.]MBS6099719.1 ribonuclease P protein component [Alistipes sp.]HJI19998.1 ribonuclease P protein component [Rikenellaceae bacterium]